MPPSKKDKKNGKDGRIAAELTKNGLKFTNDRESPKDSPKGPSPTPSPPPLRSPDLKPSYPSSNAPPLGASPNLDAVSTTSIATSASPKDWPKGAPAGMAGSPPFDLLGDSPPTQPSSYEDPRLPSGWSSPRPHNALPHFEASPSAASPPPLSLLGRQLPGYKPDFRLSSPPDMHARTVPSAAAAARRSSMQSPFSHTRHSPNPPLPYQPQSHFYGVTNIDNFDPQQQAGLKAGERGYYFGFDTLPSPNANHVPGKGNVALAGYEGGLEVWAVGKRGLDHIANLKGLRGGVYHAKILPWTAQNAEIFPLVAVVVHGPVVPEPAPGTSDGGFDAVSADRSEAISNASDTGAREHGTARPTPEYIEAYQTTVEVYSLKTCKLVQVLLEAPKVQLSIPITSPIFKPPPPSGALSIKSDGSHVVVSSGLSGECWVYRQVAVPADQQMQFVCLGKLWTTLQYKQPDDMPGQRDGQFPAPARPTPRPVQAIISLDGRWLAYCPAAPNSSITQGASPSVERYGKAPGLTSVTPPQLPLVNVEVDQPGSESVVNKIMRDATQEFIQGAKWVSKQGLSAWHNYWNPQNQVPARSPPSGPQGWGAGHAQRQDAGQFPPTHGAATQAQLPKEPGLIAILDLDTLTTSSSLHPVATFQVPHGCSFLSLAPSGLLLFTASRKGDVHTVWDLMRTHYTRSSTLQPSPASVTSGPRIRQVAQFSRMTIARVVDVAWTRPNGERAAVITDKGTVHLVDLPSVAFAWPPPRQRIKEGTTQVSSGEAGSSAVSMASNALNTVRNAAVPLISRPQRSNSAVTASGRPGFVQGAAHGGRAIAAGISHSLGMTGKAAFNQLRPDGDKRLRLPISTVAPESSCVIWIKGRKGHRVVGLGHGVIRMFPPKTRRTGVSGAKGRNGRPTRSMDFKVRQLPDDTLSLSIRVYLDDPDQYWELSRKGWDAGNNVGLLNNRFANQTAYIGSAIPQAEIESSAPYQPFHTDRRVALFERGMDVNENTEGESTSHSVLHFDATLEDTPTVSSSKKQKKQRQQQPLTPEEPAEEHQPVAWAFGLPIEATKLDLGLQAFADEETFDLASDELRALPSSAMETVFRQDGDAEQLVVTTRRRPGRGPGRGAVDPDEDGFFEDDCDVLDFADQRV